MTRAALVMACALVVAACGGGGTTPDTVPADAQLVVTLKEYTVALSVSSVKAGTIKIAIQNSGTIEHEFELIKTDLAPDKLPVDVATATAKEDGLVKQLKGIGVGRVATVTAQVVPGNYLVICNFAAHYQLGMRAALKVE